MTTWIALLRGVNVGGHRKVPMTQLREVCVELGLEQVRTYIQSGNVVLRSDQRSAQEMVRQLEAGIERHFGFAVPVVVRSLTELRQAVTQAPDDDVEHRHVVFLPCAPAPEAVSRAQVAMIAPATLDAVGADVHLLVPQGLSQPFIRSGSLEKTLGVAGTSRNRRTVARLLEMAAECDLQP